MVRLFVLGTLGAGFWASIFAVTLRILYHFKKIETVGDIVILKLLSMLFITAFALLLFSAVLTSLSELYLSQDLPLVLSMPVPIHKIFIARMIGTLIESSWMVIVFTLPIFIAYGIVFRSGPFYYALIVFCLLFLSIIASAISAILVMTAVMIIPANRMKSVVLLLGLTLFIGLYVAFRMLRPELLVDPEVFSTVIVYMNSLKAPSSPYLPTTWAYDALTSGIKGGIPDSLFHAALLFTFSGFLSVITIQIACALYFNGFSKTRNAPIRMFKHKIRKNTKPVFLKGPVRAFFFKEIKTFFRDQTQWTQLLLIGALIIIYIFNFKALPIEKSPIRTVYLQNLLAFLNMGLALFVLTAVAARFAFPAVSSEKDAFWIVKSSPIPLKRFLMIKFLIYYFPLLVLAETLVVTTNYLLHVTDFMMFLSTTTVFFLVPGVVSLGIGIGAAYPDFKAENPTKSVTSFGGILYMVLCGSFIAAAIILEAGPVYRIFQADFKGRLLTGIDKAWIAGSFIAISALSITAVLLPLKFGEKKLKDRLI